MNAGQDYLFRGEAPEDTAGATAHYAIDDSWHELVLTYDQNTVKPTSTANSNWRRLRLNARMGSNPFPLLIGDGFEGAIDEVSLYDSASTLEEIRRGYHQFRP